LYAITYFCVGPLVSLGGYLTVRPASLRSTAGAYVRSCLSPADRSRTYHQRRGRRPLNEQDAVVIAVLCAVLQSIFIAVQWLSLSVPVLAGRALFLQIRRNRLLPQVEREICQSPHSSVLAASPSKHASLCRATNGCRHSFLDRSFKNLPGVREFETKVAERLSKPSRKLFHVLETLLTPKRATAILDKTKSKNGQVPRVRTCGQMLLFESDRRQNEWYSRFGVREKM